MFAWYPVDAPPRISETLIIVLTQSFANVDLGRCHTGTGFEGRHFRKNRHVDFSVKGVRRFGVLKALLCRGSGTELPLAWVNAD